MGKKTKVGKQRKDKYYQLAKETGFRSRAAFKLIQLNRKFGFLQKSRVCIDLCAAPGGWMQVAHQNMPVSSIVIGVDLFPIKQVPGCISLTEDITTDKCKTAIKKEIKTWKADVVLHDGAPNVGLNWIHDAYQQSCLTLSAMKLASNFLREGGWFVTKVFRSKDYHALLWILKQFFKKVHATKPQASRNESSEIFVVCQGYIAPDSIDPKLLDPKHVFEDLEIVKKQQNSILHPEKQKKAKAVGYQENDYTTFHSISVSDILEKDDPIDLLQGCSEILIDDKEILNHPRTTSEIKECCKDIKVLGRKDVKALLSWLKHIKDWKATQTQTEVAVEKTDTSNVDKEGSGEEKDEVEAEIAGLQEEERKQSKRKRKQLNKQRQKLAEKMNLKMVLKGDDGPIMESHDMFKLADIKNSEQLQMLIDQQPDIVVDGKDDSDDEIKTKAKYVKYDVEASKLDSSGLYYKDSDSELEMESDSESDKDKDSLAFSDSDNETKKVDKITKLNTLRNSKINKTQPIPKNNPLLTDLDNTDPVSKRSMKADLWFQKDSFKDIDEEDDEGVDLDKLAETYREKGKKVKDLPTEDSLDSTKSGLKRKHDDTDGDSSDSDYDVEDTVAPAANKSGAKTSKKDGFEVVAQDPELKRLKKSIKMDAETLALGTMLATSKKFKRDLIDDGWNRYAFNDKNLPDWFVEDEKKHMKKEIVVPEKYTEEYKNKLQDINTRPIKKVVEAKARKKKRMIKKMERAKKKVEVVMENADMSEREKAQQVRQLYKKAQTDGKKKITYVVAKKHTTAKRMKRPTGVKGQYKVVDPRMKKDLRAQKAKEKTKGRGKKGQNKPQKVKHPNKKRGKAK
ncbi:pre-rRNA 2'-O-ribose RNA methyltransferase FTSJ3 [Maniola hyperantus]|uniref:pre-rRNA 2'-O-ribose RNA methyltransferase FTSJ3 n=1 Tax=Aphantopus hyperantus TaxID=2795564 RepID=UPI001567E7DA|nr:pre-rRNA 2'-O-ribose RNA methyltransferase FTSJ3 isoform X1 [Maniola hyperantus]XP_034840212.1 pre-rRNA 2'-O-ribose RNA methyltransferase FTSJ3 isoform X2 [Maniola hyperantus]